MATVQVVWTDAFTDTVVMVFTPATALKLTAADQLYDVKEAAPVGPVAPVAPASPAEP